MAIDYPNLGQKISAWLKDYLHNSGLNCFVVGVSGGIDSAVSSTLAAQTGIKTYVLNLPIHSNKENSKLADLHCKSLSNRFGHARYLAIDLTPVYDAFIHAQEPAQTQAVGRQQNLAAANSKARLRMTALYYVAGKHGGLVVGTGNKVEDFGVGFFTKYGDGGVDLSPIADLTKTQVRELGQALRVAPEIIAAPPTDGLWQDNRNDEQQLGASYEELEWAMAYLKQAEQQGLVPSDERQCEVLTIYRSYHSKNLHKMQPIPVFRLNDF